MRITGLDHIVLNTPDQERALAWYTGVLGLAGERVEAWRRGEVPFPSVRIDAGTIIDLFAAPRRSDQAPSDPNLNHFCLVLPAADWEAMVDAGEVEVERGPSQVFGARGMGVSIYTRDPDGNVVELRRYAPAGP